MTAKGRELYFTYPDNRDNDKPGFEIPAKGQLIVLSTPEEIQRAKNLGYTPMEVLAHSPKVENASMLNVIGMNIEDGEIIPFPNRQMTDQIAEMISPRLQNKSQS
jgi:hypothetical protein